MDVPVNYLMWSTFRGPLGTLTLDWANELVMSPLRAGTALTQTSDIVIKKRYDDRGEPVIC